MRVRLGFGPSGEAASERRTIEVLDVFADPSLEDWQEVATELGFRSFVALPLQAGQATLGTVTFYFASPQAVGADTRQLMRMVADQMAATAEKARLIEDLRKANAALTHSNAQLERQYADAVEARRIKDEFLSNISHELRTPLTAVIGYISLMQDGLAGPITGEQQQTLGQVKEASEQLLTLIGDLLELTALKRGALDAVVTDVDPRDPLRDAVAAARGRREHVRSTSTSRTSFRAMRSDRRTVAKALKALMENAYKFTRDGRVRVSLQVDGRSGDVSDRRHGDRHSAGCARVDLRRVPAGGRIDDAGVRRFGARPDAGARLAQLVHGDVSLASSTGAGSTFKLELPLQYETQGQS